MPVGFQQISDSLVASTVAIENNYKRSGITPPVMRIAMLGQYLSTKTPTNDVAVTGITSADDIALLAGYGSQAHIMALTYFAEAGANAPALDWFPIADGTTAKAYTITFVNAATSQGVWRVYIIGKRYEISVASGDAIATQATALAAVINADLNCPFTASPSSGVVTITAKWKGLSSDSLDVRKNYYASDANLVPGTTTMTIASSVSGATDPSIATAVANFGNTFYNMVITGLNSATVAGVFESAFTSRIDPLIKKPLFGVMGWVDTRANFLTALGSRNNPGSVYFPVEGSPSYIGQISAAFVAKAAVSAAADPARPWKNLYFSTILPGTGAEWTYAQAQAVELAGGSTYKGSFGSAIGIWDALTTYKTNAGGAADISWRYPETITNTQRKLYDLDTMLNSPPFDRAKIIADTDVAADEYAISPLTMRSYFNSLFETWVNGENWSTRLDDMKASLAINVNGGNPSRMDVSFTDYMVLGLRVIAVQRNWTF